MARTLEGSRHDGRGSRRASGLGLACLWEGGRTDEEAAAEATATRGIDGVVAGVEFGAAQGRGRMGKDVSESGEEEFCRDRIRREEAMCAWERGDGRLSATAMHSCAAGRLEMYRVDLALRMDYNRRGRMGLSRSAGGVLWLWGGPLSLFLGGSESGGGRWTGSGQAGRRAGVGSQRVQRPGSAGWCAEKRYLYLGARYQPGRLVARGTQEVPGYLRVGGGEHATRGIEASLGKYLLLGQSGLQVAATNQSRWRTMVCHGTLAGVRRRKHNAPALCGQQMNR